MNKDVLKIINEEFSMVPEAFGGTVAKEDIDKAIDMIGVDLPDDYIEFICRFGCGGVKGTVILGLGESEFFYRLSFVEATLSFRNELPDKYEKFVVVGMDGAGNPVGFNAPDRKIILFDHDSGEEVLLANDFSEYLQKACYDELGIQF